jgi:carboxymethylenebutenolidase
MVQITSGDGRAFDAYLVRPARGPPPAIIVAPSIYAITPALRAKMDAWAAERGYVAICHDVFWRTSPGPLTDKDRPQARGRLQNYRAELVMDDFARVRDSLAALPEWNGKFAVVGYCFGGEHAFLGLTRLGADAAASFHGTSIQKHLDEAHLVTKPFSFHFGGRDELVPPDDVERIRRALAGKDGEVVVYPEATHGFARAETVNYNPDIARISEERAFGYIDRLKAVTVA